MHGKFFLILFLTLTLITFEHRASGASFSTEVVAQIGKEVVTSRKIKADILIESFWDKEKKDYAKIPNHSEKFNSELDRFLIERIVYLESKSFNFVQVDEKAIKKTESKIISRIKQNPIAKQEWESLQMTPDETASLVRQKIASEKFIAFKSQSSLVPVTEAEAFNYYQNNIKKYEGKEYRQVKDAIKKNLSKEQAEQRLSDWYDILRKKYEVMKVVSVGD